MFECISFLKLIYLHKFYHFKNIFLQFTFNTRILSPLLGLIHLDDLLGGKSVLLHGLGVLKLGLLVFLDTVFELDMLQLLSDGLCRGKGVLLLGLRFLQRGSVEIPNSAQTGLSRLLSLSNSYRGGRFLGLHILQLLALEPLDSLQNPLDGLLCLDLLLAGQHHLLHGLGRLQTFALKARDTWREKCYSVQTVWLSVTC